MEENLYNFIIALFIGFLIIYHNHPKPKIIYKKINLGKCNINQENVCIEE